MAVLEVVAAAAARRTRRSSPSTRRWRVMETVGFAAFFGDRVVAAVGGAAMLPLAAAGVAGIARG